MIETRPTRLFTVRTGKACLGVDGREEGNKSLNSVRMEWHGLVVVHFAASTPASILCRIRTSEESAVASLPIPFLSDNDNNDNNNDNNTK